MNAVARPTGVAGDRPRRRACSARSSTRARPVTFSELAGLERPRQEHDLAHLAGSRAQRSRPARGERRLPARRRLRPLRASGEHRERSRRRRPAVSRAARRADPRDDQPRRRCTARWSSRSPRSTAITCSAGRTGSGAPSRLHCTALGKVLLAYGAARAARRAPRAHDPEDDHASVADLEAELAEVRRRGYAVADEELEAGLVAVAAPVRRDGRAAIAAISVSGPSTAPRPARAHRSRGRSASPKRTPCRWLLGYRPQREGAA